MYKLVNKFDGAVEGFYERFTDAMTAADLLAFETLQEYSVWYGDEVAYDTEDSDWEVETDLEF